MTLTKTLPARSVHSLGLHEGDTLHILTLTDEAAVVTISHPEPVPAPPRESAREWLKTARGSVQLMPGETVDDVRMGYYAEKYQLPQ